MHRYLVVLITVFAATLIGIPRASAGDSPIGHLGDTLRVDTGKYVADVTVSFVQPVDPPPGFGYNRVGVPVKSFPGSAVMRADVAIHAIRMPTPYQHGHRLHLRRGHPVRRRLQVPQLRRARRVGHRAGQCTDGFDPSWRRVLGRLPRPGLHRRAAGQEDGLSPGAVEPVAAGAPAARSAVRIATTDSVDVAELAEVAARTFPLACPPSVPQANIASFIDANLSDARFAEYLADPRRD